MNKMKFLALSLALVLSVPTLALAIQTNTVDVTRNLNKDTAAQVQDAGLTPIVEGFTSLMNRYMTNFKTCEPVHLKQSIDLFGLKISYQFDINGWKDNKCVYYMTGNIGSLGTDIRDVFKVKASDEMIAKIKPVVQCNFTREQLDVLVEAVVAAQERSVSEKVNALEGKKQQKKQKMSPAEEKLMEMLVSGNVCTVPNQEELMQSIYELMEVSTQSQSEQPNSSAPSVNSGALTPVKEDVPIPELRRDGPKVNMPSAPTF